ncbi:phosphorothioated DNA-binding restriction endonuclease [Candidatus Palauibacter sp.]|uniref:phosphorothioated DNA-binding restriction endonuclease n=1 Tax=Candidatus Palauibacter sp. TaxID=3101350 RepID=UPI003B012A7B
MGRDEFLSLIEGINVWRRGDSRAPHKPLLLLLALARVARGEARLAGYEAVVEDALTELLRRFGPPRVSHHPDQPFQRLPRDGLWEIRGLETPGSARIEGRVPLRELRKMEGGFPAPVHRLLRRNPQLVEDAVRRILEGHFPASLHTDIRDAVGLPDYGTPLVEAWAGSAAAAGTLLRETPAPVAGPPRSATTPRDPRFRHRVLRAYERRCAVCGFDVRVEDQLLGLEAAHIKWHAAGGPDEVPNGLALCSFHHKALDVGALGLEEAGESVAVLVSSEVNGQSAAVRHLLDFRGERLRPPRGRELAPAVEFVAWHRREVFRGPALSPRR